MRNREENHHCCPTFDFDTTNDWCIQGKCITSTCSIALWKFAPEPDPPFFDAIDYGWSHHDSTKSLTPKTLPPDVDLAPPEVLELFRCGCSTNEPCSTQRCGCHTGHLPCTFFCVCHAESHCQNAYNKDIESGADDENEEVSYEIETDLMMEWILGVC